MEIEEPTGTGKRKHQGSESPLDTFLNKRAKLGPGEDPFAHLTDDELWELEVTILDELGLILSTGSSQPPSARESGASARVPTPRGLQNQGATCYLNSLLQTLFMAPEFRLAMFKWGEAYLERLLGRDPELAQARQSVPLQLLLLFVELQAPGRTGPVSTMSLTRALGWRNGEAQLQQDVQEMCRKLFEQLGQASTNLEKILQELYEGVMSSTLCCPQCSPVVNRSELKFKDISLPIQRVTQRGTQTARSIKEAFDWFTATETLDDSNRYDCPGCKQSVNAKKSMTLTRLPYMLNLHLMRFSFLNGKRSKIYSRVTYPETLEMGPHIDAKAKTSDANTQYELCSVLVHKGEASSGHYYAFVKSFRHQQWFEFNDEVVSRVSSQDVLARGQGGWGSNASAYMLCYRKIDPAKNELEPEAVSVRLSEFAQHLTSIGVTSDFLPADEEIQPSSL